ncbi:TPR-like protein [Panus rudis PR-1116 ss-1]|nr:TPR-like protein [Panus rudis PR-1116 ss-1]
MSLPLLVSGAECGPVNPLQGLSKRFDQDRGVQQDYFGANRAGPSRETFRSQYNAAPGASQDASRFFSQQHTPGPIAGPSAFDLSALHTTLPPAATQSPQQEMMKSAPAVAAWAADFMSQQFNATPASQAVSTPTHQTHQTHQVATNTVQSSAAMHSQGILPWSPTTAPLAFTNTMVHQNMMHQQPAISTQQTHAVIQADASQWEVAFESHESHRASDGMQSTSDQASVQETRNALTTDVDEFARTAGELLEVVKEETNPKFRNSKFLSLMRQVRDKEIVLEGNDLVTAAESSTGASATLSSTGQTIPTGASRVDVKGKGRAVEIPVVYNTTAPTWSQGSEQQGSSATDDQSTVDPNEAYFRQENEEYMQYWRAAEESNVREEGMHHLVHPQAAEWERLQEDWDAFEATATGLRPVLGYSFQTNNPYLMGEASQTRHHSMHSERRHSLYETVLEMEAAVQRNRTDARAWFELGVKQQENEREQKAIQALRRALELDPSHLPSWLALAVSYTNEGNRTDTYGAIRQWVDRNDRYKKAVDEFRAVHIERDDLTQAEKSEMLAQCLIAMARSDTTGEIDPDIQIALAVLLNSREDYEKAKDCFMTALAVRPDDWLLYNRVGATLANSGKAEDALQYYYRALELNPAYIRARFNLGISCLNLRRYEEGSQAILDALVLQDSDSVVNSNEDKRGVTSATLWQCLKTCCIQMQRIDLANICDQRDLDAFRLNYYMQ